VFIRPIETNYRGCRFRSRLEARWAVFFDTYGVPWEYERQGYELPSGRYLPDFWIPLRHSRFPSPAPCNPDAGYWVEIKPVPPTPKEQALFLELALATGHNGFLFAGNVGVGQFQVFKACCTRSAAAAEWYARHPETVAILTTGDGPPDGMAVAFADRGTGTTPWEVFLRLCELDAPCPAEPPRVDLALVAARSARFEYGETPR
jgi:hypothetical protein